MRYVYYFCSKGHRYRAKWTEEKLPTNCPFCGSKWRVETTREDWLIQRGLVEQIA